MYDAEQQALFDHCTLPTHKDVVGFLQCSSLRSHYIIIHAYHHSSFLRLCQAYVRVSQGRKRTRDLQGRQHVLLREHLSSCYAQPHAQQEHEPWVLGQC